VCVTALFDGSEIVRSIRIERVFSWHDGEVFRKAVTQKYGPVSSAHNSGSAFALGWGPEVSLGAQSASRNALTAHYMANDDFMSRSGNRIAEIRIVLDLLDAQWAAAK
jgi:hypothetical protein